MELTLVIFPGDTELDDTLGDLDDLEGSSVLGVLGEERFLRDTAARRGSESGCRKARKRGTHEGSSDLVQGLLEFGLGGEVGHDADKSSRAGGRGRLWWGGIVVSSCEGAKLESARGTRVCLPRGGHDRCGPYYIVVVQCGTVGRPSALSPHHHVGSSIPPLVVEPER